MNLEEEIKKRKLEHLELNFKMSELKSKIKLFIEERKGIGILLALLTLVLVNNVFLESLNAYQWYLSVDVFDGGIMERLQPVRQADISEYFVLEYGMFLIGLVIWLFNKIKALRVVVIVYRAGRHRVAANKKGLIG